MSTTDTDYRGRTRDEAARDEARHRHQCAYWLAVGAHVTDPSRPDYADAFAASHRADALAYYLEQSSSLQSIPGAWRDFLRLAEHTSSSTLEADRLELEAAWLEHLRTCEAYRAELAR